MSTLRRIEFLAVAAALALAACGSKTPESDAAKKLGEQPKQMVDKAAADVNKAMQQEQKRQEAEKKE